MDVYVPLFKQSVVDAQSVHMRLDIFKRNHGRLFHHVAQVARQGELAGLSFAQRGLDEENLSAHTGPCQACHHAGIVVALVDVAIERRLAKQRLQLLGRDVRVGQLTVHGLVERHLSQCFVDLLFQLSHAAFAGILLDNLLQ